jgi:hypothetical protein
MNCNFLEDLFFSYSGEIDKEWLGLFDIFPFFPIHSVINRVKLECF